jgi:uracil-DNA glycosylase
MAPKLSPIPKEDWEALDRHLTEVRGCRKCPTVEPPPVASRPETWPRVMLVGQAPGPREVVEQRPFAYTAGSRLFSWFAKLGVSEEEFRRRVWMCAVIRCFPGRAPQGGDRVPAPLEIANCAPYLEEEIQLIRPTVVLAVGQLAIAKFLPEPAPLKERVGRIFEMSRGDVHFGVIPLPHPSGRSTWLVNKENQALLDRALGLLAESAGWRETFGEGCGTIRPPI